MMKTLLLFTVVFLFTLTGSAQKNPYDINYEVTTDKDAHYSEGDQKLYEHVFYHLQYSDEAKEAGVKGQVTISFKVQPDGRLTDVEVLKGVGYGIGEQIANMLKDMKFSPAVQNGVKISSTLVMNFPVSAG